MAAKSNGKAIAHRPRDLVLLENAVRALQEATTIDEIKDIRDKAEAIRAYSKVAGDSLESQNLAAEVKIRAERKAGALLAETPKNAGARGVGKKVDGQPVVPLLSDLGVSQKQSERWQAEASVPDEVFEEHVETTKAEGKELTTAGVLRLAAQDKPKPKPSKHPELDAINRWADESACLFCRIVNEYGGIKQLAASEKWSKNERVALVESFSIMSDSFKERASELT